MALVETVAHTQAALHFYPDADVICDVGYATALLDLWVRRRPVLSLEKAVHKLTQRRHP